MNVDPSQYDAKVFGVESKGCGVVTTTGDSDTTTVADSESSSDSSLGEVTGAGGIVALIAIISGIASK